MVRILPMACTHIIVHHGFYTGIRDRVADTMQINSCTIQQLESGWLSMRHPVVAKSGCCSIAPPSPLRTQWPPCWRCLRLVPAVWQAVGGLS